jgi:TRAP-type C4-dicarboxylate transport system permease small subunit
MDVENLYRKSGRLSSWLAYAGALSLFVMMCLTMADVVGRYIFNAPILGVFELTEFMVLILIFSFIGYTQSKKTHVSVDLLVMHFSPKVRLYIELFNHGICLILMALITWMGYRKAVELMEVGEASPNLGIPDYPFVFFLVLGCGVMCIEYVRDLLHLFGRWKERNGS